MNTYLCIIYKHITDLHTQHLTLLPTTTLAALSLCHIFAHTHTHWHLHKQPLTTQSYVMWHKFTYVHICICMYNITPLYALFCSSSTFYRIKFIVCRRTPTTCQIGAIVPEAYLILPLLLLLPSGNQRLQS